MHVTTYSLSTVMHLSHICTKIRLRRNPALAIAALHEEPFPPSFLLLWNCDYKFIQSSPMTNSCLHSSTHANSPVCCLQMPRAVLYLVALCVAFAHASPAISEVRQPSSRPGRFLSLPVPSKCSQSKQRFIIGRSSTRDLWADVVNSVPPHPRFHIV